MCKITMTAEKTTKNTVRFTEVLEGKLTNPVIGTVYIPKDTLKAMGWEDGADITMEFSIAGKPAAGVKRKTAADKAPKKAVAKAGTKVVAKKKASKKA